jgi:alpha-beta hydrolase superfamily lysophospholipase
MRYLEPLTPIIESGFLVYAADHRGHGMTSGMSHLGDFGPGGAPAAVDDMAILSRRARAQNPDLPLILLGHSMGAMFSQNYLLDHSALIDALVLSGTAGGGPRPTAGPNAAFPNPRTDYDWLSRDDAEVDRYIADPFCGIRFTKDSAASFTALRERRSTPEELAKVKTGLPVYIFVGDADPINARLERLTPLVDAYRAAGLKLDLKVYPDGRHEMLNETNRAEVVADLKAWLDSTVAEF